MIQPDRQPTRLAPGEIDPVQPIDPTSSLAEGLERLWLPLPSTSGGERLYDLSGRGRHGTLQNMVPSEDWGVGGGVSYPFLSFPDADDSVKLGSVLPGSLQWTIGFFFRSDTGDTSHASGEAHIFSVGDTGSTTARTMLTWRGENLSLYAEDNNRNSFDIRPDSNLSTDIWYHGIVTRDGDVARIYIDGDLEAEQIKSGVGNTIDDQSAFLGEQDGHDFTGSITAVQVYNRALFAGEAFMLSSQARRGFPSLLRRRDESSLYVSGTNVVSVSEAAALQAQATLAATGTATTGESAALSATGTPSATDSATATEQAVLSSSAALDASETATITEAVSLAATATWSITETVANTITEAATLAVTTSLTATESGRATESGQINADADLTTSEQASVTEAAQLAVSATWSVVESVGSAVTEAARLAVTTSLSATETATGEESAQVSSTVTLAAQEAATASEALRLETEARLDAKESITVTEAARVQVDAALDLIEEATTTEAVKLAATATWSVTETVGKLITGRISEVGRNTVELLSRPFNNAERKDG